MQEIPSIFIKRKNKHLFYTHYTDQEGYVQKTI